MNLQRYVNLAFVIAGLIAWVVMQSLFGFVIELIDIDLDRQLLGAGFRVSNALGLVCGIAVGLVLKLNKTINTWATEVANELMKVTWPTWQETRLGAIVVIITSIVVALVLGFFDYIWAFVTSHIYGVI
jgi:preprotein translocase subunit SecE